MKEPTSLGGQAEKPGGQQGEYSAPHHGQVASQDQTGIKIQIERSRADLPDQERRNGHEVGELADLVQEEFIHEADPPDPEPEADDEKDGEDDI